VALSSSVKPGKYIFHTGFLVSFLASLPPGMTNVVTLQLAMLGDYVKASSFALGVVAAEVIYAKICSSLVSRMLKFEFIVTMLQWLVFLIFVAMAVMSFLSIKTSVHNTEHLLQRDISPFILGFFLMAINPVQIPFWIGWITILTEKKIFVSGPYADLNFVLGVGLGSLAASAIFIASGQLLFSFLDIKKTVMHFTFGCIFGVMAVMQAVRLFLERSGHKI
jgi:threonine/homoserine/homoserine lactone efflux protein